MSDSESSADGLCEALHRARVTAQRYMSEAEAAAGMEWHEETITDLLLLAARPYVTFETFSKNQESKTGADWLWWWIDASGECFGMLVQAKRLRGGAGSGNKTIDFHYNSGQQLRALGMSSDVLQVPAMYVLYMGDPTYRLPVTCGQAEHTPNCERCSRLSVAMMTWLLASMASSSGRDGASLAFTDAFPIEDLADPATDAVSVDDLNIGDCEPELRAFLRSPQTGARLVAKTVFRAVSRARRGMFSMDTMNASPAVDNRVFDDVPKDSAHYSRPYFDHILRGLRRGLPAYVEDLRAGLPLPDEIADQVKGVALFYC